MSTCFWNFTEALHHHYDCAKDATTVHTHTPEQCCWMSQCKVTKLHTRIPHMCPTCASIWLHWMSTIRHHTINEMTSYVNCYRVNCYSCALITVTAVFRALVFVCRHCLNVYRVRFAWCLMLSCVIYWALSFISWVTGHLWPSMFQAVICYLFNLVEHIQNTKCLSRETFTGKSYVLKYVYIKKKTRCVIAEGKCWEIQN